MRQLTFLLMALAACEHRPPPPSPFQPASEAPPTLVLHEAPLPPVAELDAILDGVNAIGAAQHLWQALEAFLAQVDGQELARNPDARRLVANAVVRLSHAPDFMEHFSVIRKAIDALVAASPDAPEARFCRAYMRWILMADGQGGLRPGELGPRIVQDLAADLRFLVQRYPDWQGPGEFTAARLRLELARVEALPVAPAKAATEAAP